MVPIGLYGKTNWKSFMSIMAVLDTSGVYTAGDDYRVIKILDIPFGSFTLECVAGCMNDLEVMSPAAAADLVVTLDEYDAASAIESASNLEQADGRKVLTTADVLEWTVVNGGASGVSIELAGLRNDVKQVMAFCPCLQGYLGDDMYATTLIRS